MGKQKRKVKGTKEKKKEAPKKQRKSKPGTTWQNANSDDDDRYKSNHGVDPRSSEYYNDEVDQFFEDRDKVHLERHREMQPADSSSDEEVLPLVSDGEDSDPEIEQYKKQLRRLRAEGFRDKISSDIEDASDNDDDDDEDDDENQKAWGQSRKDFYGGNVGEMKNIDYDDEEADPAIMEEREAIAIQKRLAAELQDDDFGLGMFPSLTASSSAGVADKDKVKVTRDLTTMTRKEKLALLKKESPELLEMIAEYKAKLSEARDRLQPVCEALKGRIESSDALLQYTQTKLQLTLSYCLNISFYMALKAKRVAVEGHPVIGRIVQFGKLLKQLEVVGQSLEPRVDEVLQRIASGRLDGFKSTAAAAPAPAPAARTKKSRSQQLASSDDSDASSDEEEEEEEAGLDDDGQEEELLPPVGGRGKRRAGAAAADDGEDGGDGGSDAETGEAARRGITYDIAKNKGLTVRKKKEYRNPRVKHRMKYRKAKISRKGQIREVRHEITKYAGETSGIRAGVLKSRRLK